MINQLVILQPINLCNLNCDYCYVPGRRDSTKMNDTILEASIKCIFNSPEVIHNEKLTILWHAGEPLAVGIEYYQKAIQFIEKYNKKNLHIVLSIQTNATLITQEWCDFFKKHHFEIGISVDGPKFLHDKHRIDWKNRGSFDRVMNGTKLMQKNGMPLNAISVLTSESLEYPEEIYHFFKENKFSTFAMNIDETESMYKTSSFMQLSPELLHRYRSFMSTLYDLWMQDHRSIGIREFDDMLGFIAFKRNNPTNHIISMDSTPFSIITISKEGDIITFSPEMAGGIESNPREFVIGNVLNISNFDELIHDHNFQQQRKSIFKGIENCANNCAYFDICGGGSPSNKFYEMGSFEVTETNYCKLSKQSLADVMFDKISVG